MEVLENLIDQSGRGIAARPLRLFVRLKDIVIVE